MERKHPSGDVLATHKVAIHIIKQFVAVDITVVIWRRDGQRMIVEQPRTK